MAKKKKEKQELITLNINGQEIEVPPNVLLVEAAKVADIEIPVFCYHPKLEPVGMCRMCLVEVGSNRDRRGNLVQDEDGNEKVSWFPKLMPACTTRVTPGMFVKTDEPRVTDAWRGTLEFLLTSHPLDCPVCDKGGECPLQDLTFAYGPDLSRFYKRNKFHFEKPIPLGDLVWLDRERCIFCSRCVRFQEDVAGDPVLKFADRNRGQEIVTYSDPPFNSYFSGNTTDICPVGALTTEDFRFKARVWELTNVPSLGIYDCVGSNLVLGTRTDGIKRVMPRANEWVNEIWLADKTRFGHHFVRSPERLETPMIKEEGQFRTATWPEAIRLIADRLVAISAVHGANSIGGITSGRPGNEDLYLFAKLMREVIGTNNIDSRPGWMAHSGIEEAIRHVGIASGSNLGKLGNGSVVITFGADLEEEQPILYLRMRSAVKQGAKLFVVQNRTTKEIGDATNALIVEPGSEAYLAAALLQGAMKQGKLKFDRKLDGGKELTAALKGLDVKKLVEQSGIEQATADSLISAILEAENLVVMVGREALASAGENAATFVDSLVGLLMATGKAGKESSGLLALWPHNNTQGALDMGVLPHLEAGYSPVSQAGATTDRMLNGEANLRAAYIMANNPAHEQPTSISTLKGLDFLIVQDLFMTETAQLADVVLPAAAFAERDGSFTNFERRVQRYLKGLEPVGQALPDWQIIRNIAKELDAGWADYFIAHDVGNEIAKKVKSYKGMTYDKLRGEPVEWMTTAAGHHVFTGTALLNTWLGIQWKAESQAKKPKFSLEWHELQPLEDKPAKGQFRLLWQRKQYDNGTMIRHSALLDNRRATAFVKMSADDAQTLNAQKGDHITVAANGTQVTAPLMIDPRLRAGNVVLPMQIAGVDPTLGQTGTFVSLSVTKVMPTTVPLSFA